MIETERKRILQRAFYYRLLRLLFPCPFFHLSLPNLGPANCDTPVTLQYVSLQVPGSL
jgi:hypothetical protein